jgi:hypothetical protein
MESVQGLNGYTTRTGLIASRLHAVSQVSFSSLLVTLQIPLQRMGFFCTLPSPGSEARLYASGSIYSLLYNLRGEMRMAKNAVLLSASVLATAP